MRPANCSRFTSRRANVVLALLVLIFGLTGTATAGGPRWVSGWPYFNNWGTLVAWYTASPHYFTDPGDLSASVNHAAADVMVANAAAVWNIPTASLVLSQGGTLNEHVSSANVSGGSSGPIFPADVQASNYASKQIAIIYDTDGSVTDMLLGEGGSDPSGCLQNGVTESVDSMTPSGQILHAILVLNGRCTGPQPEKQLQMQYQLMRAFGRILGLSWSQLNDNVFTASPAPTNMQALNWPIMHPIDILCGLYTYQCLPQPFTLRPDDISALEQLYFISQGQAAPGKQESWSNAGGANGYITFPNGQGMEGVNVVVQRRAPFWDTAETWQTVSSVSGQWYRGQGSTSITGQSYTIAGSMGVLWGDREGFWRMQSIPVPASEAWNDLVISTEPINPLYIGPYAIGMGSGNTITPSGAPQVQVQQYLADGRDIPANFAPPDAAPACPMQNSGTEAAPVAVPQGGWWTGSLCAYGYQAWNSIPVKANRTLTVEVTALDENGQITMTKAMPVLGVWNSTDATGTLPTVASAVSAFNSLSVGLTSLQLRATRSASSYRVALADQRGAGRPDFNYQARVLYADSVTPANLDADGGPITITGTGFRQGNTVLVNGIAATVTNWSSTSITATAPTLHGLGLSRATTASVTVKDVSTGGSSLMTGVLSYAAPVEALELVSAPSGTLPTGTAAPTTFSVKAIAPDGFTPIVGESVSVTATGAGATLGQCTASPCTVLTNAAGIASVSVTPTAAGSITLSATSRSGTQSASFTAISAADVLHLVSSPASIATTGTATATALRVQLLASGGTTPRVGSGITVAVVAGSAQLGACSTVPCTLLTDASGMVTTTVTPTSTGTISVQFASASSSVIATFSAANETVQLASAPTGTQPVGAASSTRFAVKVLAGDGLTPVAGEAVVFTASGSPVQFGSCGGAVCTLITNGQGIVQSSVTPTGAGAVTLSSVSNAGAITAHFTAVAPADVLLTVSAPTGIVYVGDVAATPFAVRITAADGVTPLAGKPVTFSVTAGSARLGACPASSCVVTTDATGFASTSVSPAASGQVTLLASTEAGPATATFTAAVRSRSIVTPRPVQYIAEGVAVTWNPQVTLSDNSASTSNVLVAWTGSSGIRFSAISSPSNGAGVALGSVTAGPLAAGARATGSVCAWTSICTSVAAQGVSASEWRLTVVSGASQSVSSTGTLATVTLQVVNATGDPVAGVSVQIEQTVNSWEAACPSSGRCPLSSTLASSKSSAISDINGIIRVVPAQISGVPSTTQVAVIAGAAGFATLSLENHP